MAPTAPSFLKLNFWGSANWPVLPHMLRWLPVVFGLCPCFLHAQLKGRITDSSGDPLAFVSIFQDNVSHQVYVSDIEGKFYLPSIDGAHSLVFRYVGYETLRIDSTGFHLPAGQELRIQLQVASNTLPETVVHAGENPANTLIRRAIAHREKNNPEQYKSFICNTYNKISFDITPNRAAFEKKFVKKDTLDVKIEKAYKNFDLLIENMGQHHALFVETVSERSFRAPNRNQERVLLNKVSGFKDMGLVALASAVQPFSFYGDYLQILDKDYVNPISPGSPDLYTFVLEDSIPDGPDTIWVISFRPRKGKLFEALEGVICLHSFSWAIRSVRAQPADQSGNVHIKIEQSYQLVPTADPFPNQKHAKRRDWVFRDLKWFPEQLNFEINVPKYPAPYAGMRIQGKSFISGVKIDVRIPENTFISQMPLYIDPSADRNREHSGVWQLWRNPAPLSLRESRTYTWLDSLSRQKRLAWVNLLFNYGATGKVNLLSNINLDLPKLFRFNHFEGLRTSIALTNSEFRPLRLPKRIECGASAGYAFKDNAWKYGGYGIWHITRFSETQLRLDWHHDILEPGALHELPKADYVNRTFYARKMDYADTKSVTLSSNLWRGATARLLVQEQILQPAYAYRFLAQDGQQLSRFNFREATLVLRYSADAKTRNFLGDAFDITNKIPILEIAYTRGFSEKNKPYERWAMALHQSFFIPKLGRLRLRFEAGQVTPDVPLAKLFTLNQSSTVKPNFAIFVVHNTFQSLPGTFFVSDRFANLYWAQEFGPILYTRKYSAPELALLQNFAWGTLKHPELHSGIPFKTPTKPLMESGIQFDNLVRINYLNVAHFGVGAALFYRYGGLDNGKWTKNLFPRFAVKFVID